MNMNKIRTTGDRRCSSCQYYANSPHILCLVNPTHMKGQICADYTKEALPPGDYRDHIGSMLGVAYEVPVGS